jgi:hypothetical protein
MFLPDDQKEVVTRAEKKERLVYLRSLKHKERRKFKKKEKVSK